MRHCRTELRKQVLPKFDRPAPCRGGGEKGDDVALGRGLRSSFQIRGWLGASGVETQVKTTVEMQIRAGKGCSRRDVS